MGKGQRSHATWDRRGKKGQGRDSCFLYYYYSSTYSVTLDGWSVALPMAEMGEIDGYVTFYNQAGGVPEITERRIASNFLLSCCTFPFCIMREMGSSVFEPS